jgi:hypothetical protein
MFRQYEVLILESSRWCHYLSTACHKNQILINTTRKHSILLQNISVNM